MLLQQRRKVMSELLYKETQLDLFENTLPPETNEKGCDSFDDLVYVAPKVCCQLYLSSLSEDQKKFIQENLVFDESFTREPTDNVLWFSPTEMDWIYDYEDMKYDYTTFNDIFIHKDDLEKQ
tara:strand:+ start:69 stop:434 length:366 start_codon:yes stop_codon:yes gene_type:complete